VADEPLIDTHVHFWDPNRGGLRWDWLPPGAGPFLPGELEVEAVGTGLAGVVHVHCADPIDDPSAETRWLETLHGVTGLPDAIVGRGALGASDADAVVADHAHASRRLRGVRDLTASQELAADRVVGGMDALGRRGLHAELRRPHRDVGPLIEVAKRWPHVTITLSHACLPRGRPSEDHAAWADAMRRLAGEPNIVCKISAVIDTPGLGWEADHAAPWMLAAIDAFGSDRCMLGSNWPLDRVHGPYRELIDMYRTVADRCSPGERADLFHRTAARVYGLRLEDAAGR
jgi:predicted TIM-barrel fold metal-dependent hydrolase